MRNYTGLTSTLDPEQAVELLNAYFDCIVPPIEAEGGEVLKYLGDGVLAIFRDRGDDTGGAAHSALTAALQAVTPDRSGEPRRAASPSPVAVGIALHHGEAAYGNVGSGERLDFTVIGRDVNLASRIAELNKSLGEPAAHVAALRRAPLGQSGTASAPTPSTASRSSCRSTGPVRNRRASPVREGLYLGVSRRDANHHRDRRHPLVDAEHARKS